MRPSGTHLYKRVCPSVRRFVCSYVRYASAKTSFLGCFWPRWDPTLKQMINQHVESLFTRLFVHLSLQYDQYTLRHSPDASLPGRACFMFFLADERLTVRRPFLYDPTVYNYLQKLSISHLRVSCEKPSGLSRRCQHYCISASDFFLFT